jgi:hypothetical protein
MALSPSLPGAVLGWSHAEWKPGDHPLADINVHGRVVFGERVDALIRDLDGRGLWASPIAHEWLYERFWDFRDAQQSGGKADVDRVLEHIRSRLEDETERRGTEVESRAVHSRSGCRRRGTGVE